MVENYLDSAVMAKLGTVTIIHGKGTGALRKAVHEILKRNKAVKSSGWAATARVRPVSPWWS